MKTSIRLLAFVSSLGLASAAFAGTVNFYVDSGQTVQLDVAGNADADIQLIDTDTSDTAATFSLLNDAGGDYSSSYIGSNGWSETGVSLSLGGTSYITGLPAGNYSLTTSSADYFTDYADFSGGTGEISDWADDYSGQNNYEIDVY